MFGITREMLYNFLIRAMVLFTTMPVHECAHGLVADKLGDDTPRNQGRLTLNPFAHLDLMGSILLFLTGFGWAKPVQVDMRNFKHPRRDMALTALAGPSANVVISLICLTVFKVIRVISPSMLSGTQINTIIMIFLTVILINIRLAVFNLLPVPPLDGSKIIGALLPEKLYWGMLRYQRQISMVVMLLLIIGVLAPPIDWLSQVVFGVLDWLTSPIGGTLL